MIKAVLFDNDGVMSRFTIPRPAMRKLAKNLQANGIKVGMLSNIIRPSAQIYKLWRSYIGYDVMLLSYREKLAKPNPEFYELAVQKFGVIPQEILFIDNNQKFLVPAQNLGFKILHSTSARQVYRDTVAIIEKENNKKL